MQGWCNFVHSSRSLGHKAQIDHIAVGSCCMSCCMSYSVALRIHHFLESHPSIVVPSGNYENLLKKKFPCWSFEIALVPRSNQERYDASAETMENINLYVGADRDEGSRQGGVSFSLGTCTVSRF